MTSCPLCDHVRDHGSWPASHRGTHCDHCHRSWAGKREAHCVAPIEDGSFCCQHFTSDLLADKHRVNGRCPTPAEMLVTVSKSGKLLFRHSDTPNGEIWRYPETLTVKPAFLVGVAS